MDSGEMFQPNSIRSLLSKRGTRATSAKAQTQDQEQPTSKGLDTDYDSIIETKMMIQDIDNKVNNIRQWRHQQKQLTEERLKHNTELVEEIKKERLISIAREEQMQKEQLRKMLEKLALKAEIKIKENEEEYDSQKIFAVLASTDNLRKAFKNSSEVVTNDEHDSFLRSISGINQIFRKKPNEEQQHKAEFQNTLQDQSHMELSVLMEKQKSKNEVEEKFDKTALQKQLQEIDRELREIEELMADD